MASMTLGFDMFFVCFFFQYVSISMPFLDDFDCNIFFKGLTVKFLSHVLPAGRGSTSC